MALPAFPAAPPSGTVSQPTLSASGSIVNGASSGATIGTASSNLHGVGTLTGETFSTVNTAGNLLTITSGGSIVSGPYSPDRSVYTSIPASIKVTYNGGATGNPSVTNSIAISVTESGSNTLTLSAAGGSTALNVVEFNDTLTQIDTINVSGGSGPYKFSCTAPSNSPFWVHPTTGVIYAMLFLDHLATPTVSCTFRAQDTNGNYGTIVYTFTITAWSPSILVSANVGFIVDPANATSSSGNVSSLTTTWHGSSYTFVTAGSGVTTTTVSKQGGGTLPGLAFSGSGTACLIAGPNNAGSTPGIAAAFTTASGQPHCSGACYAVVNPGSSGSNPFFFAATASTGATTWSDRVAVDTNNYFRTTTWDDTTSQLSSITGPAYTPNTLQVVNGTWDTATTVIDMSLPPSGWTAGSTNYYWGSLARTFGPANSYPPYGSGQTPNAIRIGGANYPNSAWTLGWMFVATQELTWGQENALNTWMARNYAVQAYTPLGRAQLNGLSLNKRETFSTFQINEKWSEYNRFINNYPLWSLGIYDGETCLFPRRDLGGPVPNMFNRTEISDGSKLNLYLYPMSAAQQAYITTNASNWTPGTSPSQWSFYGGGVKTEGQWYQRRGFWSAQTQHPRGLGIYMDIWNYTVFGGSQEMDLGEGLTTSPGYVYCTVHFASGGSVLQNIKTRLFTERPTYWQCNWYDNQDGTDTYQRFIDYYHIGVDTICTTQGQVPTPAYPLINLSTFGAGNSSIANPAIMQVFNFECYGYPFDSAPQPPQFITQNTISGSRGNGNTLANNQDAKVRFFPPGSTHTYTWSSFRPDAGETQIGTGTSISDTSALATYALFSQDIADNSASAIGVANLATQARTYLAPTAISLCGHAPITETINGANYTAPAHGNAFSWTPVIYGPAYEDTINYLTGLSFSVTSGYIPGISFNSSTGNIYGTPSSAGSYPVSMQATWSGGSYGAGSATWSGTFVFT